MKFVQIHTLVSYPASNLNRDDLGRPKTVKMGDSTRLRVSSQSLKRAWRTSDIMSESFPFLGIRTKKLSETIEDALIKGISLTDYVSGKMEPSRNPVSSDVAKKYGKKIDGAFRDTKTAEDDNSEKKKQLFHYSDSEIRRIDEILEAVSNGASPEIKNLLSSDRYPVDIAMFGRMVANDPSYNCEAAIQVAHAFTVHKATVEEDYFTAVDDLNKKEDSGAGHLGETSFGAGLFYNYICIDFELLTNNLGSEEEAHKAIKTLLRAVCTVSPTGKQNSFASRAYASFIAIEKGDQQPRSLASAFFKPIRGDDILGNAIESFKKTQTNMNKIFGDCYDDCYIMDVTTGDGSLKEADAFLG